MKNFELKKEVLIWLIILLPVGYLYYVWNSLPEIVPTHFGIDGKPNDWSHKTSLIYIITGMLAGIYILLSVVPVIDPKGKISMMGNKYFLFKLFMMLFMSAICFFIIRSAITQNVGIGHYIFVLLGAFFVFLGNYMPALKPNYFIGIRTPWTLENETVWRKTHQLGGKLFFIAGLLIMALSFILKTAVTSVMLVVIFTASIIPIVYSYMLFRQHNISRKEK